MAQLWHHKAPIDRAYILEQLFTMLDEAHHFTFGHYDSDLSMNLYGEFASGIEKKKSYARTLDPLPKPHPFGLTFYRHIFHQTIAANNEFLTNLSNRNLAESRFFMDMEKTLRVSFYEMVQQRDLGKQISLKRAYDMAQTHAEKLPHVYVRGTRMTHVIARMIERDTHDDALGGKIHSAIWAVDLAAIYTGALLGIKFHASQLVLPQKSTDTAPYTTQEMNIIFEAGFHLARHITVQVIPDLKGLGATHGQMTDILSDALTRIGRDQAARHIVRELDEVDNIGLLVRDAVTRFEEALIEHLPDQCALIRSEQIKANQLMQAAMDSELAHAFDDADSSNRLRDKETEISATVEPVQAGQSSTNLEDGVNQEVVEAGETIIEYLRNIQFGDVSEEKAVDVEAEGSVGKDGDSSDSGSSSGSTGSTNSEDKKQFSLEDLQFEVAVNGEEKRKMKLSQIMAALKAGLQIQFASKAQAKTFLRAALQLAKGKLKFNPASQMKFSEKGVVKPLDADVMEEMGLDAQKLVDQASIEHHSPQDIAAAKEQFTGVKAAVKKAAIAEQTKDLNQLVHDTESVAAQPKTQAIQEKANQPEVSR